MALPPEHSVSSLTKVGSQPGWTDILAQRKTLFQSSKMTSYAAVAIEEDPCPPEGIFDRSSSLRGQDLLDSDDRIPKHLRHQASKICILGLRVGISLALFCVSVFM